MFCGMQRVQNISQGSKANAKVVAEALEDPGIRRMAGFIDGKPELSMTHAVGQLQHAFQLDVSTGRWPVPVAVSRARMHDVNRLRMSETPASTTSRNLQWHIESPNVSASDRIDLEGTQAAPCNERCCIEHGQP